MRKPLVIAVLTLLGSSAFAAGEVYRWKDSKGVWNYSDQNHPGAELVRGTATPSAASTTPAQTAAATPAPAPAVTSDPLPVSKEVAEEVRQEASAIKAKQCEKAKVYYEKVMQTARLTRPADANGKVTFLTPAEIDKARLDARAAKDLTCGP